jgi:hypothetical protein
MALFISYSHEDDEIVEKIAAGLASRNKRIWLDKWELNYGDSLIQVIQEALISSSALLIMLSKKSVESEWCKKEITAGLMRELEEKRVVVVPILLDDCKIPIFLRDKYYADFRGDFNIALNKLDASLSRFTDISMSRVEEATQHIDWAIDYGELDNKFHLRINSVCTFLDKEFSFLCHYEIATSINVSDVKDHDETTEMILKVIESNEDLDEWKYIVENSRPVEIIKRISDQGIEIIIFIELRWMGINDGYDKLYNYGDVISHMINYRHNTCNL